ncbi:YadA-like family protein [Haemophilus haemolyticus]|uniref:YadA-like family protein n=1 Tax=Haemophilus haemolyticus TaxID=726 RepID=UPI002158B64F|nr:YadA-like family protein [Haemophilus haemolyticus]
MYKRQVWSQATQSWVVVSELTKAHKKQSASNAQKSAVKFSGNFIKSLAIALALLSGHSAYAVLNQPGTGSDNNVAVGQESKATQNNAVAVGKKAQATGDSAIALGFESESTNNWSVAIGLQTKATNKQAVAVGSKSKATGENSIAIGNAANASNEFSVALGSSAESTKQYTTAVGGKASATQEGATALGYEAKATAKDTIAIGKSAKAEQEGVLALGSASFAQGKDTIAIGNSAAAKKEGDIIIGKDAKSRNEGGGRSVAIGFKASAGSNRNGHETNDASTGTRGDDGSVAIGTNAYTGLNKNNTAVNNSVALGAGAGVGYRSVDTDGKPLGVGTDADDNDKVLVKAFGGTTSTLNYFQNSGKAKDDNFFSFQGVDINEGTALGRNTRAIGDQSVAIGAQSVAGQGSIVIGGNDIQAYDGKKYFKAKNPDSGDAKGVNDFNAETTPGTGKNGQPITITAKYKELVGAELDRSYRASYGQDGSTVIGMQAHSTTPLGVAIGTNSIVRKGAFGATAIGSGASIWANAEAAVAIGMGAEAQGNYAVAAGTAARAKESAVAAGYQANADKSAVAVGDSSKATNSSVAVGQLAQATKEADIAVGQGAKASGNQGAIAMGLGTNAQGDSSIMIGGADIKSASARTIEYQKATGGTTSRDVTEKINGKDVTRHYSFSETKEASGTIADAYKELTGLQMETNSINFADANNKNGHASTSLGVHALSKGDLGTAIGASSRADAIGSVALGVGAHATKQNAVAIGTGSTTALVGTRQLSVNYDSDGNIVSDNSDKIAYTFKWAGGTNTSEGDVVSFGSSGAERQLKNVAAGRVAEDSTDAINGSQLNSITKKIAAGFNTSGNEVAGSSGVFTSKKANANSADKAYETAIRSEDKVQFQVGNNLKLDRDETVSEVDAPDDFDKTKTVKKKIRKADFAYSLNPVLTNLTSAEFKGTDANAPTTKLTNAGVTITPVTAGKSPVSLSENGLNNGGNPITDVAGNLDGAKANTQAPTTNATAPNTTDKNGNKYINPNNAATVGDVLNAGWNLKENTNEKDFVTAYDTVNFVDGEGTTVSVTNTDGKTSTIKYSANLGDGLEKTNDNKIKVKAADKSLEVTNEGVKVKAADNTLTTDANGLKVNTGNITASSVPTVADADKDKIATIGNVAEAIKAAAWKATSAATTSGENTGKKDQEIKAGDTVTFEADKNIKIAQADGKFTFATKENVTFNTVQVGGDQGPKLSKSDAGDLKVSGPNSTDPVKVTNVKDGDISADSKDAINGSQFHKLANNTIQLKGQTGDNAVTETNKQALNKENGIAFTVKSSDGTLLEVTAANDTITLTPKTATLTTGADGVPTADTTNGKLVTADQLVNTLTEMGWKATAGKDGSGTVSGAATELIKAGNTVTFKAGDNLAVKQDGKNFIYSLQKELTGLTSAEFKNQAGDTTVINSDGMKITPKDAPANPVSLTKDGLDNGGKTIKNVTSGLTNYGPGTPKEGLVDLSKPATGNPTVPDTTAATVGDLRNMGWVVSSDKTTGELTKAYTDQVKNADEVKFVGEGGVTVSGKTENGVRTITVKAEAQEMPEQPVSYTTADGTKVYPKTVTKPDGSKETKYYSNPEGTGTEIPKENVIASINGPEGTKAPTTLSNVAGNLDGAKKGTTAPTTEHGPVNTADAAAPNYVNPNNAATVGDVLNAGWNLQNNSEARDFVRPYDTVNFVDGINTKAVVTTDAEGKVSNVQIDVKDLPVAYTNEAGDKVVKAADGKYYKESDLAGKVYDPKTKQFKNADGTALNEQPKEVAGDTVKTNLVNPNAEANKAGNATQLGNVASGANTFAPVEDKKLGNDGKWYPADQVESNGQPKKDASPVAVPNNIGKAGLIDFSKSNPNNAATVGDLQNLGWIVSAKGNDYSDQVRNANEVKFVGEGTASVTGKTDENGVRTITVKVDDQVSTNNAQMPVNYTTADGTKVYPVKDEKGNVTYHTTPDGKGQGDKEIPKGDVITSINGPEGTTTPTTLKNVKGNLPQVNDQDKTVNGPDGKPYTKDGNNVIGNTKAPITAVEAADIVNKSGNNAATVGDVLNAGWNLQNNGEDRDFVKPYDTVNFVNGTGTVAVVETNDKASTSNVTFNVDMAEMTPESDGSVKGPVSQDLLDALDAAQAKVDENPNDEAAQEALKAAEDAVNKAGGNKVANAQNVADMINSSGFTLKTSEVDGGKKVAGTKDDGELINPGKTVEMVAGKNMSVKQDENGKVTYATKDDVSFNTVNVGDDNTYIDEKGNPVTKKKDGTYVDANGQPIEESKVTKVAPVAMKAEKAKPATNNGNEAKDQPTTALNVSSTGGKPTQITGVGSTLNVNPVDTNPNGTATTGDARPNLVDLVGTDKAPVNKNAAATVGDLQNMGWIVGAPENGYVDTVKNANKVDFKGENGISVTGKTNDKGVREITISVAEGKVTNDVKVTKADGTVIDGVKGPDGKLYKKGPDGKPDTSKEITLAEGDKVNNEGSKFVSGNAVATAIQESGWNVGLADSSKANAAFSDKDKALSANKLEKVNPNDNVRFADGKGTKAAVATVERVDEFGKKVTDTYVKFDVDAGEITADTTKPGMVKGPVTADEAKKLADDLKKAEQAVKDLPADATPEAKKAAQDALKVAQDAAAPLNKVATAQNVAEAINNSGWRTNSTTATGGAKDTLINPGKAVNFEAGKNMEVAQTVDKDGNVAYTYKTKDDVQFNSVQFGDANGPKITNNGGNINVSGADGKAPTKITGVAAGDISPNSTDAVNGAQIYALVGDQSNVNQTSPTYTKVDLDENGKPSYTTVNAPAGKTVVTAKDDNGHDVPVLKTYNVHSQKEIVTNSVVEAIHNMNEQGIKFFHSNDGVERPKQEQTNSFDSSASGKFATAIGSRSKADGTNAVAIGFNSVVTGNDSISIGTGNRVTGNNSGAFGDPSTVSGQGSYSVGNNNTVATNDTFVLGNEVKHTVENSAILGAKSTARGGNGSKTGTLRNLKQDGTQGASTTAGSTGTVSTATVGHMTYGGFQGDKADGVVSVGAAGNERRIQNVAAGEISKTSTDAINGSQLYAVAAGIGHKLGDLDNKINKVGKRGDAGTASALAAANIPQAYTPGKSLVGIAAGSYQGQNGLAVGMSRISDNGKIIIRLSGTANSQGKTGVAAGVGYQW